MPDRPSSAPPSGPLASPPIRVPERIDPDHSTRPQSASAIRAQLDARQRDIEHHLMALKREVTTAADVTVGGRPLTDVARDHALRNALIAVGVGAVLGLIRGFRKRSRRRAAFNPAKAFEEARLDAVLDAAARLAARGKDVDESLQSVLRSVPAVYPAPKSVRHPKRERAASGVGGVVLQSAAGFAAKTALDLLTKRLTGHEETFSAVADAADGA